jgi:hypothetical protein
MDLNIDTSKFESIGSPNSGNSGNIFKTRNTSSLLLSPSSVSSLVAMAVVSTPDNNNGLENVLKGATGPSGPSGPPGPLIDVSIMEYKPITDAPTIVWNMTNPVINNGKIVLKGNRTLVLNNLVNGTTGTLVVYQDNVGGRKLVLPSNSKVINNNQGKIFLSSSPNSIDILSFTFDGTFLFWSYGNSYS